MNTNALTAPSTDCENPQKKSIKCSTKCLKKIKKRKNKRNKKISKLFSKNLLTFHQVLYIISLALRDMRKTSTQKKQKNMRL